MPNPHESMPPYSDKNKIGRIFLSGKRKSNRQLCFIKPDPLIFLCAPPRPYPHSHPGWGKWTLAVGHCLWCIYRGLRAMTDTLTASSLAEGPQDSLLLGALPSMNPHRPFPPTHHPGEEVVDRLCVDPFDHYGRLIFLQRQRRW